ncbi:MAG: hypothetical protein AAFW60_08505, partial [Pseudomonadota bacterium]
MARLHDARLSAAGGPAILLESQAVCLEREGARISGVRLRRRGQILLGRAKHVILACGGLGVLRLLLNFARSQPGLMQGEAHLGRGYMGHLTGSIADL